MQTHFVPGLEDQFGLGLTGQEQWNMRTKFRGRKVRGARKDPKSASTED